MASTYSPLKIELITTGEQSGTWGSTTNVNLGTALEEAITGSANVTFASANVTLTLTDTNGSQTARNLRLRLTGTTGAARDLIVPAIEKQYIVQNDTANTVTIKNSTGTGVAIPSSVSAIVFNDGTNITSAGTYSTSIVTPLLAATDAAFVNALPVTSGGTGVTTATGTGSVVRATSPTISSPTLTTPALGTPASGVLTSCTGLPLSTGITGTLGVTNGGTGVTTSTGSGSNVLSTSPTLVTPLLGTPTSGTLTNCTGLPVASGVSGLGTGIATFLATPSSANLAAALTDETGTGANVFATSPTLVTPALGTPSALVGTNITGTAAGLSIGGNLTGTSPTAATQTTGTNNTTVATTAFVQTALQLLHPVGSIYTSTSATNPGTAFGFGTWVAFGAGRVMIGNGGGFSAGATGGSADAVVVSHTHTATVTDAGHAHTVTQYQATGGGSSAASAGSVNVVSTSTSTATTGISVANSTTGVSGTNANLQPYVVVYMWNRTA